MRGIDISNYQAGIILDNISCDFVIIKATEDVNFVDPYCDGFVQDAKRLGMLWGVYHFARCGNAREQARFFVSNCLGYIGDGVLVLDIEDAAIDDWAEFANEFCDEVEKLTGVIPMVYCSAAELQRFRGSNVPNRCGLWCAGYPYPATVWTDADFPYLCDPWEFVCVWQFTSSLQLGGYRLDGDIAYIDSDQWGKYARGHRAEKTEHDTKQTSREEKTIDHLAHEVIMGRWGVDPERKKALEMCGYDYQAVQNRVNDYFGVAHDVIKGYYGNGIEREERLSMAGYNPFDVQYIVNEFLK